MGIVLNRAIHRIWQRKIPFFIVFFVATLLTLTFLTAVGFVPEAQDEDAAEDDAVRVTAEEIPEVVPAEPIVIDPYPTKIIFDALEREVPVLNPASAEIAELDAALLEGAVRHPDSADFSEPGNVFILGHSSYLPNVFNRNYQAFNGIQELEKGDTIRLQSGNAEFTYVVDKVFMARASDVVVPMTPGKAKLTLATCNSFGTKDDRFVVEASLVSEELI